MRIRQAAAILLGCGLSTQAMAQPRFPEMLPSEMTAEQKAMYDAIMAGPRHSMAGPFNAWLRSPILGDRLQAVGEYLRFKTAVPHNLNEFAILITAIEWRCGYEWFAHYPLAIKAGLEEAVAEDLKQGKRPTSMTPDEALVYDFATQLHRQHQVADDVYQGAVKRLGEQGVMDLTALLGYYDLVSMTLNMAGVRPPETISLALEPPPVPASR
jgi:4-carboxymuconolactone decarboxylase